MTTRGTSREHSAGIIVYRQLKNHREYLLLHYPSGHFDFPKGHIEEGETEKEAAYRELIEETGIEKITWKDGYRAVIDYTFQHAGRTIHKDVVFFLAQTTQVKINISHEHQGSKWLKYQEAYETLTFDNAKDLLQMAEEMLAQ